MDSGTLVIALVLLAGSGVASAFAWRSYKRYRLIADTPTSKARSMAVGPVEVQGAAVVAPGREPLVAPLTLTPCLYWQCTVEEQRTRVVKTQKGTRTEKYWATLDSAEGRAIFGVRDDTGVAVVDPKGASLPTPHDRQFDSGFLRDPPSNVVAYLTSRKLSFESWLGMNKTMRFREHALPIETPLFVLGNAVRADAAAASAFGNEALVIQREGRAPFIVSDKSEKSVRGMGLALFWALLLLGLALAGAAAFVLTGGIA